MKNYFGEKYALEYAFLVHYQAWLLIPSFFGVIMVIRSIQFYATYGNMQEALDTRANGIFGLFVAFWASLFYESWKRKEKTIAYIWACKSGAFSKADERSEVFEYYDVYNPHSRSVEKQKKQPKKSTFYLRKFLSYTFLCIVLAAMVAYQWGANFYKSKVDE